MKQMFVLILLLLTSITTYAGCERFSTAKDARLTTMVDGSHYSFHAVAQIGDDLCISYANNRQTGGSEWIKFQPRLASQSISDSSNSMLEEAVCSGFVAQQSSWISAVYSDIKKIAGYSVELSFRVQNANVSGKLKREIICSPTVFGLGLS